MVGNRLTQRVSALEGGDASMPRGPYAWIVRRDGETKDDAIARYEAENGPLDGRGTIIWSKMAPGPARCD